MKGYIHSFQSMGAVDGPGIRYVVFMQGCPLRCVYCHNPDTWEFHQADTYTPQEVLEKIRRFRPYLKNGGVTVTGGEPLSQPEFVLELFQLLKEDGFHTALDTSGIGNLHDAKRILQYTDLVLVDLKFQTPKDYQTYCKADFHRVKEFLDLTKGENVPMWIRRVIVPAMNDTKGHIEEMSSFLSDYPNLEKVELLPFKKLCLEKYERLGIPFPLTDTPQMSEQRVQELQAMITI